MRGEVTEYAPSEAIAFRQELRTAPLPGGFTIQMQYQLRVRALQRYLATSPPSS